jgi:hypothetical protein
MRVIRSLLHCLSLLTIPFLSLVVRAQTSPNTQGYPQIGPPSYAYSPIFIDASQFCTYGFNFSSHSCNDAPPPGTTKGSMWQAIASAATALYQSTPILTGVIDARAFQGSQLVPYGVGTTALYGGNAVGVQVNGVLLLGDVKSYCDGPITAPPTGTYSDGNSGYGTPCIIVPWGFQVVGTTPLGAMFVVCGNSLPSPCTHVFPQRSYSITNIATQTTTQLQLTFASNTFNLTAPPLQNIFPVVSGHPSHSGELVAITSGSGGGVNFLRTVFSATTNSLTIAVPSATYSCSSNCGTAYLVTPVIGFGVQGNSSTYPYVPVRTGTSQSFATRLINLAFDLGNYPGAVAVQNVNGGEQSGVDTIYCEHPSLGCVDVGSGANESGPYNNIYVQTLNSITNVNPTTFGIYNGSAGAGFHRFTMTSDHTVSSHPTAAIYDDGSNVVFDGEPHNEGTVDTIDLAPNIAVFGVTVSGIVGPPSSNSGTNLVHLLNDGFTAPVVAGSIFSNLTQQGGSTYAVVDDINNNNVLDQYLSRYEFDSSGDPVSGATSQSNSGITTINGSGLTSGGPASATSGSLTLNGSTSGSAAITVSSTGGAV